MTRTISIDPATGKKIYGEFDRKTYEPACEQQSPEATKVVPGDSVVITREVYDRAIRDIATAGKVLNACNKAKNIRQVRKIIQEAYGVAKS